MIIQFIRRSENYNLPSEPVLSRKALYIPVPSIHEQKCEEKESLQSRNNEKMLRPPSRVRVSNDVPKLFDNRRRHGGAKGRLMSSLSTMLVVVDKEDREKMVDTWPRVSFCL